MIDAIAAKEQKCRDLLSYYATTLVKASPTVPVHLGRLCSELNVGLARRSGIPRFNAYLAQSDKNSAQGIIFLPTEGAGTAYERFCIAHELGHLLLIRELQAKPNDKSQYWRFEELCDDFARKLLVPDSLVERHLAERTPLSALGSVSTLSRAARVPWIHAATRISESLVDTFFLRLAVRTEKKAKVVASTYPRQKERGRLIDENTEFVQQLLALSETDDARPIQVAYETISAAGVPSWSDCLEAAATCRKTNFGVADAYLAVIH